MNIYTKNIASLLKITIEEAVRVQDQMEINGVDFSEVSTRTFNKEAKAAAQEIASAMEDYDHKFLVQWVEGYGDAKPQVVRMSEMENSDDWGLDEDFLSFLNHSKEGEEISYTDPSGIVIFQKAPRI